MSLRKVYKATITCDGFYPPGHHNQGQPCPRGHHHRRFRPRRHRRPSEKGRLVSGSPRLDL